MSAPAETLNQALENEGWDQGDLLDSPPALHVYALSETGEWLSKVDPESEPRVGSAVLISQQCDIINPNESFVEAISCSWMGKDTNEYLGAALKNSSRYFLLGNRQEDGQTQGLVANASVKFLIDKTALLSLKRVPGFQFTDHRDELFVEFKIWLGGRYSRPALDPKVIELVHDPVIKVVKKLEKTVALSSILKEIRCTPLSGDPPYEFELVVITVDGVSEDDERIDQLRGRLSKTYDPIRDVTLKDFDVVSPDTLSLGDYLRLVKVSADQFTFRGETTPEAYPVML